MTLIYLILLGGSEAIGYLPLNVNTRCCIIYPPYRAPSSSGLGHIPFKDVARVRIPLGSLVGKRQAVVEADLLCILMVVTSYDEDQ